MEHDRSHPRVDRHGQLADAAAVAVADEGDPAGVGLGQGAERADQVERGHQLADDLGQADGRWAGARVARPVGRHGDEAMGRHRVAEDSGVLADPL